MEWNTTAEDGRKKIPTVDPTESGEELAPHLGESRLHASQLHTPHPTDKPTEEPTEDPTDEPTTEPTKDKMMTNSSHRSGYRPDETNSTWIIPSSLLYSAW